MEISSDLPLIEFRSVVLQWWNKFSGQLNLFNELISDSNYILVHYTKYVKAIANLQTKKFKDTGDVDSDSDSEIEEVDGEVEEESTQAAEEQAEPTPSQSDI